MPSTTVAGLKSRSSKRSSKIFDGLSPDEMKLVIEGLEALMGDVAWATKSEKKKLCKIIKTLQGQKIPQTEERGLSGARRG